MRLRTLATPSPAAWLLRSPSPRTLAQTFSAPVTRSFASCAPLQTGKKGAASQVWIQRQRNDPYVRARAASGTNPSTETNAAFVSRAAFKLLELHAGWKGDVKLLRPGMAIVDLGAAPGGWIQAALEVLQGRGTVVGVDLLPLQRAIGERDGVRFVQGDFLDPVVQAHVKAAVRDNNVKGARVDLVLSDMMAAMSGNALRDASLSLALCEAALAFAVATLSPVQPRSAASGDSSSPPSNRSLPVQLVIKHFTSEFTEQFRKDLGRHFHLVRWVKPPSSRKDSKEGFFVCAGFRGREAVDEPPAGPSANAGGANSGVKKRSSLYF
ncbi:FtsJ-like methyltransferase-domain-containing protein [Rhodotorula diobovata]|uniref:rRNA methyltransferase 2, mitochondrial n=1 Tax=Rhodotorula diobovata TaxID=5288 RepID=A0A5C5FK47_9BASI|nr:FtsJ-like methyltransferase-domain-containing protein [Rhodotorula diobovata]